MATKKPAPKAKQPEKSAAKIPAKAAPKAAPAKTAPPKALAKVPAKPAVKAPAKAAAAPAKATKAPVKPVRKPDPKVAEKSAPMKAAPVAKAPAPVKPAASKSGRTVKAAGAVPPSPLVPEAVAPPAPRPVPAAAPKPRQPEAAPVSVALLAQAAIMLEAIQSGRAVELIFADENANPPRTFEPRRLIFDVFTKAWFAWGWDRRYNAERHHRLDQLAEVNLVDGPGRAAQGPFKEGAPANQIGGWLGGEPIPVKATLMKQWIFAVKQAPAPFPDFHMEDAPDGKATVSYTATDLRAISRWCMQFGDGIQVLEPQRLIDRIKQVGVAWGGKPAAAAAPAPKATPAVAPTSAPSSGQSHRQERDRGGHRRDRSEHRDEPRHSTEHRPEHRPEHRDEPRRDEPRRDEPRREREAPKDESKGKPAKVEVRVERL